MEAVAVLVAVAVFVGTAVNVLLTVAVDVLLDVGVRVLVGGTVVLVGDAVAVPQARPVTWRVYEPQPPPAVTSCTTTTSVLPAGTLTPKLLVPTSWPGLKPASPR